MAVREPYATKLARLAPQTLLPLLDAEERSYVEALAERYRLTLQQLRQVAQAARDLAMWREGSMRERWETLETTHPQPTDHRLRARQLVAALGAELAALARDKRYPTEPLKGPPRRRVKLQQAPRQGPIEGRCPAYSERTICCGLHTLDAVTGCPFDCAYCSVQTFYGDRAELLEDLPARLAALPLEPGKFLHLGTGQSSDALVWGNSHGLLEQLFDFARERPWLLLELKTKSDHVDDLLRLSVPSNVVCSWTLAPEPMIVNEEHGTANLAQRLEAARAVADQGIAVAFHCHPMAHYVGWQADYQALAEDLMARFATAEVLFFSLGSMTLIRPVVSELRKRGGESKVLQMELTPDVHGKLSYPDATKIELFSHLYRALTPWHAEVFFYLCMEPRSVWEASLGFCHADNAAFEGAFGAHFAARQALAR